MERVGTGHAKLLLFGEHAAVYGFPSLGLGLPYSTTITVVARDAEGWRFPDLPETDLKRFGAFIASASKFIPALAGGGGEILVSSTIPRGLGFGSSAALCVALAEAFAEPDESPVDAEAVDASASMWSIAHRAEAFFHGRASGIDTGLSLLGGLRSFRPAPLALPRTNAFPAVELHLVFGAVPRRGSTAALVAAVRERLTSNDDSTVRLIEELGEVANRAIELIGTEATIRSSGSSFGLGRLLGRAHAALRALGLGDPGIDRLLEAGLEHGASGGKQSGAGGGGAFFLVYPSEASAKAGAVALDEFAHREEISLAAPLRSLNHER